MPTLTPEELSEARRRSGRLGGRPRKPTVAEARQVKLEELVPKAVRVLEEHLAPDVPAATRQRAAEHVLDRALGRPLARVESRPTVADELAGMTSEQLDELAREALTVLGAAEGPPEAS